MNKDWIFDTLTVLAIAILIVSLLCGDLVFKTVLLFVEGIIMGVLIWMARNDSL